MEQKYKKGEGGYFHYCYEIYNKRNGMKYFGVRSSEQQPDKDVKYWGSGSRIMEAIRTEGVNNFEKRILECFETRDEAMEYEEYYMTENDCVDNPEYYNLSWKSSGGRFDYHEDLSEGKIASPQEKNGNQKSSAPKAPEVPGQNMDGTPDKRSDGSVPMGGPRPKAGRPKGARNIVTKQSVNKLMELDCDPIEELVRTYHRVMHDIENTRSVSARTSLYNTQQKIMATLISYGYRPIPKEEKHDISVEEKGPMSIILTSADDSES